MPSGAAERLRGDVEDRMGDAREAVAGDPEAGEPLDRARGVDDDAVDRAEDVQPRVELSLPTRDDVVGGEHRPPLRSELPYPACVDARPRKPLEVDDVRLQGRDPPPEAQNARPVLDGLQRQAQRRAREAARQPRREWEEELVAAVAVRRGRVVVGERRGKEVDVEPAPRQRCREPVVVRRREARGVDQRDAHQSRLRRYPSEATAPRRSSAAKFARTLRPPT